MPIFKAIAAMASNHVIGNNGKLPWHIPEELQWFRQTTLHQILLMGRKTFESMGCRPLPYRTTYVLSSQKISYEGIRAITSIDELSDLQETIWLCGGTHIYEQFLPLCSELFLSVIHKPYEGDAFFPEFEHLFKKQSILKTTEVFDVQKWVRASQTNFEHTNYSPNV